MQKQYFKNFHRLFDREHANFWIRNARKKARPPGGWKKFWTFPTMYLNWKSHKATTSAKAKLRSGNRRNPRTGRSHQRSKWNGRKIRIPMFVFRAGSNVKCEGPIRGAVSADRSAVNNLEKWASRLGGGEKEILTLAKPHSRRRQMRVFETALSPNPG